MPEENPKLRVLYLEAKNKAEITREGRDFARQRESQGDFECARRVRQLADWCDIQLLTIREQKLVIYELRKGRADGEKVRPPVGLTHSEDYEEAEP